MNQNPLISVIVPVYRVEPYLDRCVQSIVDQTYKNLEIILVDDGSPDCCPEKCDKWAVQEPRITVIHKKNGGLSDARNAGLARASGKYICFIDSDDWIAPQFLEILYFAIAKYNCDLAECDFLRTTGTVPDPLTYEFKTEIRDTEQAMELHLKDTMFRQVVWNKLYRRKLVTVLFEKGKYHEDVFWTYQILAKCQRLAHVDAPLYYYFQRSDSIMGETYSLKRLDAVEGAEQRCLFINERFPALSGLAQGQFVGTCMYHSQLLQMAEDLGPIQVYRRELLKKARHSGLNWKQAENMPFKQRMWLQLYLWFPTLTCSIRNWLKIGL